MTTPCNFCFSTYKALTNVVEQMNYITKCFIPLTNGEHIVFENGQYKMLDQATLKKVYFNRLDGTINDFYFKTFTELRTLVCEFSKPMLFENKFNVCPPIKARYAPYEEFSIKTKQAVQLFLQFIREVLASDCEDAYEYILNWISNTLKGKKNDACLYLKGPQGIGKSTISDFLKECVLGLELFLETGSSPLKNKFNSIVRGKLVVQFTELENFSTNEWASVSSVLKRWITSTTYMLEGKNENAFQIENINNYILDSNNDAIKDDDGRRYFIADVSPKYQNNRVYFGSLRNKCFNDDVGNAFYSMMLERDTAGFIPQNFPDTKNKLSSLTKRLDSSYLFLKSEYVLRHRGLKIKPKDLYEDYLTYCKGANISRIHSKGDFMMKLREINIDYIKNQGNHIYKVSSSELLTIADKQRWIHELDWEEKEITTTDEVVEEYSKEYVESLLAEIQDLKLQLGIEKVMRSVSISVEEEEGDEEKYGGEEEIEDNVVYEDSTDLIDSLL